MKEPAQPPDATGRYRDYNGRDTWVKDVDLSKAAWPLGRVWSDALSRWRSKRERIRPDRVAPLATQPPQSRNTRGEVMAETEETEGHRAMVERTRKDYGPYVSATPGLISLLYDIDLLPEQLSHVLEHNPAAAAVNCRRMIAVCELWKRQASPT